MSRWCVPAPALRKGGAPASPLYNDCMEEVSLEELLDSVRAYPGFERKKAIGHWARRFVPRGRMGERVYGPGDDAGAAETGPAEGAPDTAGASDAEDTVGDVSNTD